MWIDKTISQKKRFLAGCIIKPMRRVTKVCSNDWGNPEQLTRILQLHFQNFPACQQLYCIDAKGTQFSGSISANSVDLTSLGRELQQRPFFQGLLPYKGMALSAIYLSDKNAQPCITALSAITRKGDLLGFIAADFYISHLPRLNIHNSENDQRWTQYKGDPSIRSTVFMQERTVSHFDQRLEKVTYIISTLLKKRGIFHAQIEFSSSRLVLWSVDSPFDFQVLSADDLFSHELMNTYPHQDYPQDASIPEDLISKVLKQFKALRNADETIYLRSGMINIINGTVGLTFSCDGFHIMSVAEFLSKDINFWIGNIASQNHPMPDISYQESA